MRLLRAIFVTFSVLLCCLAHPGFQLDEHRYPFPILYNKDGYHPVDSDNQAILSITLPDPHTVPVSVLQNLPKRWSPSILSDLRPYATSPADGTGYVADPHIYPFPTRYDRNGYHPVDSNNKAILSITLPDPRTVPVSVLQNLPNRWSPSILSDLRPYATSPAGGTGYVADPHTYPFPIRYDRNGYHPVDSNNKAILSITLPDPRTVPVSVLQNLPNRWSPSILDDLRPYAPKPWLDPPQALRV